MGQIGRAALKSYFETGDIPTEAQFIDLIDSLLNFIDDGNAVFLTGNQTIAGIKTFTSSPVVPAPTTDLQAATKKYVDDNSGGGTDFPTGLTIDNTLTYLVVNGVKFGNGNSVLYQSSISELKMRINTVDRWIFGQSNINSAIIGAPQIQRLAATATAPIYTFLGDSDTGIGKAAADQLSLIAGGVEIIRCQSNGANLPIGLIVDNLLTYLPANGVKFGDGDTAIYEDFDDQLRVRMAGVNRWTFYLDYFRSVNSAGAALVNQATSATTPTVLPHNGDLNTGLGRAGSDQLSNIAGGVEVIRCTTTGAYIQVIKSGATQAAAGANAGEMWKTSGHATLPDNVIMHGV